MTQYWIEAEADIDARAEAEAYEEDDPRATCPVCGEQTIRLHFVDDLVGDAPMTGWITFLDGWSQDCGCVLTDEQGEEIAEAASA